jgi:hypothetical protein
VPYRDSKLTRLLQDSLGGNALALIIICISQNGDDSVDTYQSLCFAQKASLVKNVVMVNEMAEKIETDTSLSRQKALEEFRLKRLSDSSSSTKFSGTARRVPLTQKPDTNDTEKLKRDLSFQIAKDFEAKMNVTVEERVNARLKELTENLLT